MLLDLTDTLKGGIFMNTFSRISECLQGLQNLQKVLGCLRSGSLRNILDFQLGIKILCLFSTNAIPPFFLFSIECVFWYWVGRSDWKKKKLKKIHMKSRNSRPWYPRTTLKVNIHIFGLTKCTIYCEKCSCFCSCFSLCCYYAHFSD